MAAILCACLVFLKMLLRNAIAMAAAWGATAAVGSAAGVDNSTSGMEWLASGSSAAGHEMGRKYRAACRRAATTDRAYETFKREPAYRDILEHRTYEQGRRILDRLRGVAPWLLAPRLLDVYRPVGRSGGQAGQGDDRLGAWGQARTRVQRELSAHMRRPDDRAATAGETTGLALPSPSTMALRTAASRRRRCSTWEWRPSCSLSLATCLAGAWPRSAAAMAGRPGGARDGAGAFFSVCVETCLPTTPACPSAWPALHACPPRLPAHHARRLPPAYGDSARPPEDTKHFKTRRTSRLFVFCPL